MIAVQIGDVMEFHGGWLMHSGCAIHSDPSAPCIPCQWASYGHIMQRFFDGWATWLGHDWTTRLHG